MDFTGDDGTEALSILGDNDIVWRHVSSADLVECLAKEERLKLWGVMMKGNASVVKYSTRERTQQALDQILGENTAAMLLSSKGPHPLLVLPMKTVIDPDFGSFSISPYAGESAAVMRRNVWVDLEVAEYEKHCRTFAASALVTQTMFYGSVADSSRRFLHKDIKLENTCYNKDHDFFAFIDYGAFSSLDKKIWVNCIDIRYLDCQMARYCPKIDEYAAESDDGIKATITATTDIYQTGLAVVELFLGHLPAEIDMFQYGDDTRAYFDAVWNFRWADCPELSTMPAPMKEWVLKALAFKPEDRFQNASEALRHPWLKDAGAFSSVIQAVGRARPGWTKLVNILKQELKAQVPSQTAAPLASPGTGVDGGSLSSSAAVSTPSTGSNVTDQSAYTQSEDAECDDSEESDEECDGKWDVGEQYEQQDIALIISDDEGGDEGDYCDDVTDGEDCSTSSDSFSRSSCCDAEEEAVAYSRSSTSAVPPVAQYDAVDLSAELLPTDCASGYSAAVEQGDSLLNKDVSTVSSNAAAGQYIPALEPISASSRVDCSDSVTNTAAATHLYNCCVWDVTNIGSLYGPHPCAGLACDSIVSSCSRSNVAVAAPLTCSDFLSAEDSSISSDHGTNDDLDGCSDEEVDGCCNIVAAPTTAAAEACAGRILHLVPSAFDRPSCSSSSIAAHAAAAPDSARGPAGGFDGHCVVLPAADSVQHLQGLMLGSLNCSSSGDLNICGSLEKCVNCLDGFRAISRSASANSMPACYGALDCASCLGQRSKMSSCCFCGLDSCSDCGAYSSSKICCGSAPAAQLDDLQLKIRQSWSVCGSGGTTSQRSSSDFSNTGSDPNSRCRSSTRSVVTDAHQSEDGCLVDVDRLEGISDDASMLQIQHCRCAVQSLPQLMTLTEVGVLQQNAIRDWATADKGVQVNLPDQHQRQQQSSVTAQGHRVGDHHQQQQSDVMVCSEATGVQTANGCTCSKDLLGSCNNRRRHLRFAAGVLVTLGTGLLVGWKLSSHR